MDKGGAIVCDDCGYLVYPIMESDQTVYASDAILELRQQNAALVEALHEIYSRACVAMGEDDDLVLYQFAQEARDIALRAAKENDNG